LARVEVLLSVDEVQGSQKDLTTDEPVRRQGPVVVTDKVGLTDRGDRLQDGGIRRAGLVQTQDRQTGRDRPA
jgi:hypothetical protein